MIMADVLKIVFLVIGVLAVFVSYWLAAAALFPRAVEGARRRYETRPWRATVTGVVVAGPLVAFGLGAVQGANPLLKLLGGALISVPVLLALLGSAGLSQRIGRGLPAASDTIDPWRRELRGGIVLALTFLLPVVGWFLVLPWALLSGCGAATSGVLERWRASRPVTPVTPVPGATG